MRPRSRGPPWWTRMASRWCSARGAAGGGDAGQPLSHAPVPAVVPSALFSFALLCSALLPCRLAPPPALFSLPAALLCGPNRQPHPFNPIAWLGAIKV